MCKLHAYCKHHQSLDPYYQQFNAFFFDTFLYFLKIKSFYEAVIAAQHRTIEENQNLRKILYAFELILIVELTLSPRRVMH